MKTEVEKFLEGVQEDKPIEEVTVKEEVTDDPEKVSESVKNRRHRRLEERLQAEREANIALNERLKAKEEAMQNVVKEVPVDERIVRIFGNDTPEKIEMAKHFTDILKEYSGKAREDAIKELRAENERLKREEVEAVKTFESKIESGLETIEDEYNIELAPGSKERKEFLDFVSKLAPKDEDGNPVELPDLLGTYEIYQSTKTPKNNRREQIAARSMQSQGQPNIKKEEIDQNEKWLNQHGIKTRL